MKLTRRQQEFVGKMIDLSHEFEGPIHYSLLAEHLGVSPFTAYDMLRLLEDKGMVRSEFSLAEEKPGRGRTERVFYPTERGKAQDQLIRQKILAKAPFEKEKIAALVLSMFADGSLQKPDFADEMLARIPPDGKDEIRYCVEVMTIVSLRLKARAGRKILMAYLPEILGGGNAPSKENLALLGGFAFGILAEEEQQDPEWTQKLFEHVQQYLVIVMQLSEQDCKDLGTALNTVFKPLMGKPEKQAAKEKVRE